MNECDNSARISITMDISILHTSPRHRWLIGGIFDFLFSAFGLWAENVSSRMVHYGEVLADKVKLVAKLDVSAMVFGLGYIVGLKYSAIMAQKAVLILLKWLKATSFREHNFIDRESIFVG